MRRFSKQLVIETLQSMAEHANTEYKEATGKHIDRRNGYAQVPKGNDVANRAYGRYSAFRYIADALYLNERV